MRAGLVLLLLLARVALAAPGRFAIADVRVNGIDHPPAMIHSTADGALYARAVDAATWNLDLSRATADTLRGIPHVRLDTLPGLTARLVEGMLLIDATHAAFTGSRIDLARSAPPAVDAGQGAYLNYDVTTFGGRGQATSHAAAVEAVVFRDLLSFGTTAVLTAGGGGPGGVQATRHETNLRRDFPDRAASLLAGDAIARGGTLARGFRFGGIAYGSNFATRPDLITFPLPVVPGEARIPTAAELFINGQAFSRLTLNPGPFEIANVPAINGAGEIQLVTRDSLGRQQVVAVPYYVTPALLREGLDDFSLEAGRVREDYSLASARYGRGMARGSLRRGLSSTVTADAFAEATRDGRVAGMGLTAALGTFAVANASMAASHGDAGRGHTAALSLERAARGLSFGFRGQVASRDFGQVGEPPGLRYRAGANAGMTLGALGSVSVFVVADARHDRARITTGALNYQKQFARNVSLVANASRTVSGDGRRDFIGVALTVPLDLLASASFSSSRQDGRGEHVADWRQNLPVDEGWAGRARVAGGMSLPTRVDAGVSWQNAVSVLSADVSHARRAGSVRLNAAGSIVTAGGVTRAMRLPGDAFAIVSVPGYPGIDVLHENQRVATTDRDGIAVIPRLRAFEANAITLDTLKLSLSTELKGGRRSVTPARRGGVLLRFQAAETHGALVAFVDEAGTALPVGAIVRFQGNEFPIAAGGQAWITGIDAEGEARVDTGTRRCTARLPMPDRTRARPRLGPITCREAAQ